MLFKLAVFWFCFFELKFSRYSRSLFKCNFDKFHSPPPKKQPRWSANGDSWEQHLATAVLDLPQHMFARMLDRCGCPEMAPFNFQTSPTTTLQTDKNAIYECNQFWATMKQQQQQRLNIQISQYIIVFPLYILSVVPPYHLLSVELKRKTQMRTHTQRICTLKL